MVLGISGSSPVTAPAPAAPPPAPPQDPSTVVASQPGNLQTGESSSKRAENLASAERAESTSAPRESGEAETATENAREASGGIDIFA